MFLSLLEYLCSKHLRFRSYQREIQTLPLYARITQQLKSRNGYQQSGFVRF